MVRTPVGNVVAIRIEDDIGGTYEGFHLGLPFVRIGSETLLINGKSGLRAIRHAQVQVAPAVGSQLPAIILQTLGHPGCLFTVSLIGGAVLVGGCSSIPQYAFIAGKCDNGPCAFVGKVGVFLYEVLQKRNQIIGAGGCGAVVHDHLAGGLSVLANHHPFGKPVPVHVGIVADIILGHDKGLLSLREHDAALYKADVSIFIRRLVGHIVDADQHIALLVHILQYLKKFILGGHDGIIVGAVRVPVKGLGGIHDK